MKYLLSILTFFILTLLGSYGNAADEYCNNILDYDFSNSGFKLSKRETIQLKNNFLCEKLDSEQKGCEWEYNISETISLKPEPGVNLKLIHLYKNHVAGSGAWGYAIIFQCKDNELSQILMNEYFYDFTFQQNNPDTFSIKSGYWQPDDPMSGPTSGKIEKYTWNPKLGKYVLKSSELYKKQ